MDTGFEVHAASRDSELRTTDEQLEESKEGEAHGTRTIQLYYEVRKLTKFHLLQKWHMLHTVKGLFKIHRCQDDVFILKGRIIVGAFLPCALMKGSSCIFCPALLDN